MIALTFIFANFTATKDEKYFRKLHCQTSTMFFLIIYFLKYSQKIGSLANVRTPMETYPIIANFILFFRVIPLERVKSGTLVYQLGRTRSIDIWGYHLRLLIHLMLKPLQGPPWPILIEAFIETHLLLKFKVRLKLYT